MFNMQIFYDQIQEENTPYLKVMRRIFHTPREAILQLSIATAWEAWGE